jgi:hypothetical protein
MDQATRQRIAAQQLARLNQLKRALPPARVVDSQTVADEVDGVRTKYLSHIDRAIRFLFPAYWHHRRPSARGLAALSRAFAYQTNSLGNLDSLFDALFADVRRLSRPDPWHDLLLIERAIAKSRIAPPVNRKPESFAHRLRTMKPRRERRFDHGGVFFVWLKTDLITTFGYPGRDPRRARPIDGTICAAIYQRSRPAKLEVVWHE